jgi:formylglycine-generating enzyme required for sulfatase activity
MSTVSAIDTAWHPLADGSAPDWASEWGQDPFGVFAAFSLDEVTQRLRWIPPGRFLMGSPQEETRVLAKAAYEADWLEQEHPRHPVFIVKGFWLFDTPCTQALWEIVMGDNPSKFKSARRPVEQVSWNKVQDFLARINNRIPGLGLTLPTEAQWEHACRAGTDTALYTGSLEIFGARNAPALDPIAWYGGNSGVDFQLEEGYDSSRWPEVQYLNPKSGTHPVEGKRPNAWGLYDMLGNVWEWCADGLRSYGDESVIDPAGPLDDGAGRVIRGGSWFHYARNCRCACRGRDRPDYRSLNLGFRCARAQV